MNKSLLPIASIGAGLVVLLASGSTPAPPPTLAWNPVVDATSYIVSDWGTNAIKVNTNAFNLSSLGPNTEHLFTIVALDDSGEQSDPSDQCYVLMPGPYKVTWLPTNITVKISQWPGQVYTIQASGDPPNWTYVLQFTAVTNAWTNVALPRVPGIAHYKVSPGQ